MAFEILTTIDRLTPANLTLRERARLVENPNDLRWRAIFPMTPTTSVRLSELEAVDNRIAGGRREWNAQGREIPEIVGSALNAQIIPVNPKHTINEYRLQILRERAGSDIIDAGLINDVDAWGAQLATNADIQIEVDAFEAWYTGSITVMDPVTGTTTTVPLGIDAARYVAAGTTLAAETNAYQAYVGYATAARAKIGSSGAARMRQALASEILKDAPAANGDMATQDSLNARLQASNLPTIVVDERTYQKPTDGGSAFTDAYYVPSGRIAFQPAGGAVGRTFFAPVTRAYDYMSLGNVKTVNDFVVFHNALNKGKSLEIEAQANALGFPTERNTYVVSGL